MKKLFILCFSFCITIGFAQNKLSKANKLFKEYSFVAAAKAYEEYLEKEKSPSTQALKNAGDSYYFIDDMIMASEQIILGLDDIHKYDDLDIAREEKKPTRVICEFNESDIELTSYEQLTLAYENIKYIINNI